MKYCFKLILFLILFQGFQGFSQSQKSYEAINSQIWEPFSTAFSTLDYALFDSIHDTGFLRISGNSKVIKSRNEYLDQYKTNWRNSDRKLSIQFRFIERIISESYASERGIYKMTINPGTNSAQSFYGKFHVLMNKTDKGWKLIMDYDSDEKKTIGEEDFKNAMAMDDFKKF